MIAAIYKVSLRSITGQAKNCRNTKARQDCAKHGVGNWINNGLVVYWADRFIPELFGSI